MKRLRDLRVASWVALLSLAILGATPVHAADPSAGDPGTAPAVATISATATQVEDGWVLLAELRDSAGKPVSGLVTTFTVGVEFLGSRRVVVATATSDASGAASALYRPTWNGRQQIVATAGGDGAGVSSAAIAIDVTGAQSPIPVEETQLPLLRMWALPVAGFVVGSVWLVLIGMFLAVAVGIRGAGRRASRVTRAFEGAPGSPAAVVEE